MAMVKTQAEIDEDALATAAEVLGTKTVGESLVCPVIEASAET